MPSLFLAIFPTFGPPVGPTVGMRRTGGHDLGTCYAYRQHTFVEGRHRKIWSLRMDDVRAAAKDPAD